MHASKLYHDGNRRLQDEFGSRRLADRLEQVTFREAFTDSDRAFIEGACFFFLATADAEGRPDCSFKGGLPGFVRVAGPRELAFPDYDGNGMFKSLGNLAGQPARRAAVHRHGREAAAAPGQRHGDGSARRPAARRLRRGAAAGAGRGAGDLPNCPRYIPGRDAPSVYAPRPGVAPVEPAWKRFDEFRDVVRPRAKLPARHSHADAEKVATRGLRYGKGRHPAGLNFGDCMAYAVAKAEGAPLLFKGGDFARTDVEAAGGRG